jgi:hypothetical protein
MRLPASNGLTAFVRGGLRSGPPGLVLIAQLIRLRVPLLSTADGSVRRMSRRMKLPGMDKS